MADAHAIATEVRPAPPPAGQAPKADSQPGGEKVPDSQPAGKSDIKKFEMYERSLLRPGEKKALKETPEIIEAYTPVIDTIANDIQSYFAEKGTLTKEQENFLRLYKDAGNSAEKMLAMEDGLKAAHTMMELDVMLKTLSLAKIAQLQKTGIPNRPAPVSIRVADYSGQLARFGRKFDNAVRALNNKLEAIFGTGVIKEGNIVLTDLSGIDYSSLPEEYKNYMDWTSANFDDRGYSTLLYHSSTAYMKLYEAMGYPINDINAVNVFEPIGLGLDSNVPSTPEGISPGGLPHWTRTRMDHLKSRHFFDRGLLAADKLRIFFDATQETVLEYTGRALENIDKKNYEKTISILDDRLTQVEQPKDAERLKIRNAEKKTRLESQVEVKKQKQIKNDTELAQLTTAIDELAPQENDLIARRDELTPKLVPKQHKRDVLQAEYDGEKTRIEAELDAVARNKEEHKNKLENWTRKEADYKEKLRKIDDEVDEENVPGLKTMRAEIKEINDKLVTLDKNRRRVNQIAIENTALEGQIDGLYLQIWNLEDQIDRGPEDVKVRKGRIIAAQTALNRKITDIDGELNDPDKTYKYNRDYFTEVQHNDELRHLIHVEGKDDIDISRGYSRILSIIFDPSNPPEGIKTPREFWERAMEILPEQKLADLLARKFNIQTDPSQPTAEIGLEQVFTEMRRLSISPMRIKATFKDIMGDIKERSMYL